MVNYINGSYIICVLCLLTGDLQLLQQQITASFHAAYAPSSLSNLRTQWLNYLRFTEAFNLSPVPASLHTILLYAHFLQRTHKASVPNYLAGVHTLHKFAGAPFPNLTSFFPKLVLRGLSKTNPHVPHQPTPITPQILRDIYPLLNKSNPTHLIFWSAALICFFSFSRSANLFPPTKDAFSPIKHLCRSHITHSDVGLLVTFTFSKTLQAGGRVHQVPISQIPNSPLCPLLAYSLLISLVPAPASAPAFCIPTPLGFQPMTQPQFVKILRGFLLRLGLPAHLFAGHSFRRGGATWAFQSGVPGELIKLLGDWRSDAYLKYLNTTLQDKITVSQTMAAGFT